jgi:VanZ family protein
MDKYVHFTFHFGFTFLWSIYFCSLLKNITFKTVITVFSVSVSYGILIEFLQGAYTTTRKADIMDVLANATGALIAIITILLYKYIRQKKLLFNK